MQEISNILDEYDISENMPIMLIRESADNAVYVIGNANKKILRVSKRLDKEDLLFEYEAVKHLEQKDIPVPDWITTKKGNIYTSMNGTLATLFDFLPGHHITLDKDHFPSEEQVYAAGVGLAHLSNAARTFSTNTPRTRNIYTELERVLSLEQTFSKEFEGGLEFVAQAKEALEFARSQNEITGFIHNDYRPSNVLFGNANQITGIIDFDWSCVGPVIKDLALALVEWSFPDGTNEVNEPLFQKFLEGYNSAAQCKWESAERLYSWIRYATLSEAATYFCDLVSDPVSSKRVISSYMYRKFLFFSKR